MDAAFTLSSESTVVATSGHLSAEVAGETMILHRGSGLYFGLNAICGQIWNLIQEPKTVSQLRDAILAKYEVEPEQCERDILTLLQGLSSDQLVEVKDGGR